MKDASSGTERQQEVRRSARSYLHALREERARRRGGDGLDVTAAADPAGSVPEHIPSAEIAETSDASQTQDAGDDDAVAILPPAPVCAHADKTDANTEALADMTQELGALQADQDDACDEAPFPAHPAASAAPASEDTTEAQDSIPGTVSAITIPDLRPETASTAEPEDGGNRTADAAEPPEAAPDTPAPAGSPDLDVVDDHALLALPGAGPGLVWMLRRSGIETLQDLAKADAGRLRAAMGLVGELVDLDYWIGCARNLETGTGLAPDGGRSTATAGHSR